MLTEIGMGQETTTGLEQYEYTTVTTDCLLTQHLKSQDQNQQQVDFYQKLKKNSLTFGLSLKSCIVLKSREK